MSEMIERVGKAIADYQAKFCRENHYEGLADIDPDDLARAAIEAMREPTDEMIFAGVKSQIATDADDEGATADQAYSLMIEAALKHNI